MILGAAIVCNLIKEWTYGLTKHIIESAVNTTLLALMAITVVSIAGLTNLFSVVMLSSLFSFLLATVFVFKKMCMCNRCG